jgi:hypothetical protein
MFMVSEVTPVAAEDLEMDEGENELRYQIRALRSLPGPRDKNEVKDMRYKFY